MKWFVRLHSFDKGSFVAELREAADPQAITDARSRQMERALNRELPGGQLRRHDIPVQRSTVGQMASEA